MNKKQLQRILYNHKTALFRYFMGTKPLSQYFGFDRGQPIDRYYIEKFLANNNRYIKGDVLEIAESTYTHQFGGKHVKKALILHATPDNTQADIIGDLETGKGIPESIADCFILTQTLPFIFNIQAAANNAIKILKPGGTLLVTAAGISQISRYDMDRWGHYWALTDLSMRKIFEKFVPANNISINTYGNAKVASCFLFGLTQKEVSRADLEYHDKNYQMLITAVVKKPKTQ